MNKIPFFLFLVLLLSCTEQKPVEKVEATDSRSLSDTIMVETNRMVTLLPEAQEKVGSWLEYATAHNQMEDLKTATGRTLISNSQPVVQIMEALNASIPDSLQEPPVLARTTVLVTKANVLNQVATKKDIKPSEVFNAANEIIVEFDNFKLQLNELFLKTPADFELELDRQFEESQDSLRLIREAESLVPPAAQDSLQNISGTESE